MTVSKPSFLHEQQLWNAGIDYVIGVDEVGRGAFAGPLVTGAVVFAKHFSSLDPLFTKIHDSKLLTPTIRIKLSAFIKSISLQTSITAIPVSVINRVGIGRANQIGFRKVIAQTIAMLPKGKTFLLVDGFHARYVRGIGLKNQLAIIKGDRLSLTIAAASIIAKVYRDSLMEKLSLQSPRYGFAANKGYGTQTHRLAIQKNGLSKHHRRDFCKSLTDSLTNVQKKSNL